MTLTECYNLMGADYGDVLRRLGNEDRVRRFLGRFAADDSFAALSEALAAGNGAEAFRAAHSLKGVCLNLGLTPLYDSVCALTEELREGRIGPAAESLAENVRRDYLFVLQAVRKLT